MIEARVECPCGQHFTFDIEPVDGKMPVAIACPQCGADSTDLANQSIARQLAADIPQDAPGAGTAVTVAKQAPAAPTTPQPAPLSAQPQTRRRSAAAPRPPKKSNRTALAIVGAVGSALVIFLLWSFFIGAFGINFPILALIAGPAVAVGGRLIAREPSPILGAVSGTSAAVMFLAAQFFGAKSAMTPEAEDLQIEMYEEEVAYAKEAVLATTEEEARALLAKYYSEDEFIVEPGEIEQADVEAFWEESERNQRLASGELTQEEYNAEWEEFIEEDSNAVKGFILWKAMGIGGWIFLFIGAGSAFKIGAGEQD